ncbi:uncharacterized [Tachysurus ichikawai]
MDHMDGWLAGLRAIPLELNGGQRGLSLCPGCGWLDGWIDQMDGWLAGWQAWSTARHGSTVPGQRENPLWPPRSAGGITRSPPSIIQWHASDYYPSIL